MLVFTLLLLAKKDFAERYFVSYRLRKHFITEYLRQLDQLLALKGYGQCRMSHIEGLKNGEGKGLKWSSRLIRSASLPIPILNICVAI
jgi:hypothetical protein